MRRSIWICLLFIIAVSCNETYYYVESTIAPYTVHNPDLEMVQTASIQNSFIIQAKNDDEAKLKAEQLFQNRVKSTPLVDFNSRIIEGYSLRKGDYFGITIDRHSIIPGIDHSSENKVKAFDQIHFGDNSSKVKDCYNAKIYPSKEYFTCIFIDGKPDVRKGSIGSLGNQIGPNYSLETQTITTKINIKDYSFTASFLFWKDQLYHVSILSDESFSSITEASSVFFQVRDLVFLANGFPSWILPLEEPTEISKRLNLVNLKHCGWKFADSSILLGFDEDNETYKIAFYANSSSINEAMISLVEDNAKEDRKKKEMKEKEWEEKASNLF